MNTPRLAALLIFGTVATVALIGMMLSATEEPTGKFSFPWFGKAILSEKKGKYCENAKPCRRADTSCGLGREPYYNDSVYQGCISQLDASRLDMQYCRTLLTDDSIPCAPNDPAVKYLCVCP